MSVFTSDQTQGLPIRVLLVDADDASRSAAESLLGQCMYRSVSTRSAEAALGALSIGTHSFDLLLATSPGTRADAVSGATSRLLAAARVAELPVLLMCNASEDELAGMHAGAREVLRRPLSLAKLEGIWRHVACKPVIAEARKTSTIAHSSMDSVDVGPSVWHPRTSAAPDASRASLDGSSNPDSSSFSMGASYYRDPTSQLLPSSSHWNCPTSHIPSSHPSHPSVVLEAPSVPQSRMEWSTTCSHKLQHGGSDCGMAAKAQATPLSGSKRRSDDIAPGQMGWGDVPPAGALVEPPPWATVAVTNMKPAAPCARSWPSMMCLPVGQVWGQPMNPAAVAPGITPPIPNLVPMPTVPAMPAAPPSFPPGFCGPPAMMAGNPMMMSHLPTMAMTVQPYPSGAYGSAPMMGIMTPALMPPMMVSAVPLHQMPSSEAPVLVGAPQLQPAPMCVPPAVALAPLLPQPPAVPPAALALPLDLILPACAGDMSTDGGAGPDATSLLSCRSSFESTQFMLEESGMPGMCKSQSDGFLPSLEVLLWEDFQDEESELLSSRLEDGALVDSDFDMCCPLESSCRDQHAQLDARETMMTDAGESYCCDWPVGGGSNVNADAAVGPARGSGGSETMVEMEELRAIKLDELHGDEPSCEEFWDGF